MNSAEKSNKHSVSSSMNLFKGKELLAKLRGGDYAHAGESHAIEITMKPFPKDKQRAILDAGCGRGGTSEFLRANGWGKVTGIDLDQESIAYAKAKYPGCSFAVCNIMQLDKQFTAPTFDLICMFNVFYNLPNQAKALEILHKVAVNTATLVIFDYIDLSHGKSSIFKAGSDTFNPIARDIFEEQLQHAGWGKFTFHNLEHEYIAWYEDLVKKIKTAEKEIRQTFGDDWYEKTLTSYMNILTALKSKEMSGGIYYVDAA